VDETDQYIGVPTNKGGEGRGGGAREGPCLARGTQRMMSPTKQCNTLLEDLPGLCGSMGGLLNMHTGPIWITIPTRHYIVPQCTLHKWRRSQRGLLFGITWCCRSLLRWSIFTHPYIADNMMVVRLSPCCSLLSSWFTTVQVKHFQKRRTSHPK
jgi:hypothetical protein